MTYLYKLRKTRCELETPDRYSRPPSGASLFSMTSFRSSLDKNHRIKRGKRWGTTTETSHSTYPKTGRSSRQSNRASSTRPVRPPSVTSLMLQDMSWKAMVELIGPKKREQEILRVYVGTGRNYQLPPDTITDERPKGSIWTKNHKISQRQMDVFKDISTIYNHTVAREKREEDFLETYADKRAKLLKDKILLKHQEDCKRLDKKIKIFEQVRQSRLKFAMEKKIRTKVQFVSSKLLEHEKPREKKPAHYAIPDTISKDTVPPVIKRPKRPQLYVDKDKLKEIGKNTHVVYFGPHFSERDYRARQQQNQQFFYRQNGRKQSGLERKENVQKTKVKDNNVPSHKKTKETPVKEEISRENAREHKAEQSNSRQHVEKKQTSEENENLKNVDKIKGKQHNHIEPKDNPSVIQNKQDEDKTKKQSKEAGEQEQRITDNEQGNSVKKGSGKSRRGSQVDERSESRASYTIIVAEKISIQNADTDNTTKATKKTIKSRGRHTYV